MKDTSQENADGEQPLAERFGDGRSFRQREQRQAATGLFRWLRHAVPTALVMAGLVGVWLWGHQTDWRFTRQHTQPESTTTTPASVVAVRIGNTLPPNPEIPSALRREVAFVFDSTEAADQTGIAIASAWTGDITDAVEAAGEIGFDPARITRLGPRAPGSVWRVMKVAGEPVAAGEVLALIESADAGKAKAEFQQALVQVRLRARTLAHLRAVGKGVATQFVREAEAADVDAQTRLLAAVQTLANLDLPFNPADYRELALAAVVERMRLLGVPADLPGLDKETATANLIPVRSPFAGVVLSVDGVAGEMVQPGRTLLTVVDPKRVWVTLQVRSDDAARVVMGQPVRFRPDGMNEDFVGRVDWIGRAADPATRAIPVRTELPNDAGRLRAGTLGLGRVVVRREADAVLIPHEAVQLFRGHPVVFVRDPAYLKASGPKAFHARPVRTGVRDAANTEILAGLQAGEVVATKGSDRLLNELTQAIERPDVR